MVTMATAVLYIRRAMVADKNTTCVHEAMRKLRYFLTLSEETNINDRLDGKQKQNVFVCLLTTSSSSAVD